MKTIPLVLGAWLIGLAGASAQDAARVPLSRADATFVIGWQNLREAQPQPQQGYSNDWVHGILYGGAGVGWYWTDHLKTQVDVGAGTRGRQYRYQFTVVNGQTIGSSSQLNVREQSVAIAQQYQFFRNQWFHPHVGAGVELAREATRENYQPVVLFDSATRVSRELHPARIEGPDHRLLARPFAAAGFKAYLSERAFFTSDARLMVRHGLDEVLFRFGFGVDF